MRISDCSLDVCSSDLDARPLGERVARPHLPDRARAGRHPPVAAERSEAVRFPRAGPRWWRRRDAGCARVAFRRAARRQRARRTRRSPTADIHSVRIPPCARLTSGVSPTPPLPLPLPPYTCFSENSPLSPSPPPPTSPPPTTT